MSQKNPILNYYSKFVSLDQNNANEVFLKLKELVKDNSTFCELGSGWGNISVPVIHKLKEGGKLDKWYGFEKDQNKINFSSKFMKFYNSDVSNREKYDANIENLRKNHSFRSFNKLIKNINSSQSSNINWFILKELDLEDIENFVNVIRSDFKENKIDVLFIPFIFQHLKLWRMLLNALFPYMNEKFVIVSGELGGDWEVCFTPYKVSAFNNWRPFFRKIWDNNSILPTALRDYKYYNSSVLSAYLENHGFKIIGFKDCPLDLKIFTTEVELLDHLKHKVWSPFIQNFDTQGEPFFKPNDFSKKPKLFHSSHNINIYSLEKK